MSTDNSQLFSTTNPLDDSHWSLISSDDGIVSPLVYYPKDWHIWQGLSTPGIAAEAEWVWNGKTMNTMTFEFRFDDIYGIRCVLCFDLTLSISLTLYIVYQPDGMSVQYLQ